MKRADYYIGLVASDRIFIVDNAGREGSTSVSVTNAAEDVVAELFLMFGDRRIICRDTQNRWDELVHHGGVFESFAPYKEEIHKWVS